MSAEKKPREMEKGSGLLRVTTHPSVPRSAAERQRKGGERGKEGVGCGEEWVNGGRKSTMRHVYKAVL